MINCEICNKEVKKKSGYFILMGLLHPQPVHADCYAKKTAQGNFPGGLFLGAPTSYKNLKLTALAFAIIGLLLWWIVETYFQVSLPLFFIIVLLLVFVLYYAAQDYKKIEDELS